MSLPSFLQLIRWKNILLMGYLLGLLNWVLFPKLEGTPIETSLFILFAFAILTIQAGGYIINDIYDRAMDQINQPDKLILSNENSIEIAKKSYKRLNIIGITAGIWFSMQITAPGYSILFIGAAFILFYYAKNLKSRFIVGNLLIALLSLVPTLMLSKIALKAIPFEIYLFAFFVFLVSLIREIVKDAQDIKGDHKFGCQSIPIVLGTARAVQICRILLLVVAFSNILLMYFIENNTVLKLYILILILLPLLWLIYALDSSKKFWNFKLYSNVLKGLFFIGINCIYFI